MFVSDSVKVGIYFYSTHKLVVLYSVSKKISYAFIKLQEKSHL